MSTSRIPASPASPTKTVPKTSAAARRPGQRISPGFGPALLVRIFHLHQRLCQQDAVMLTTLAEELGVSDRTVARDVSIMRDDLGAPIERDVSRKAYRYTEPCDHLPVVKLEPAEAFALAMAARIVGGAHLVDLGNSFTTALKKLIPLMGGAVSFPLEQLNALVTAPPAAHGAELRHLETFLKAALQRRAVRLVYQAREAAQPRARIVHPLHLAQLKGRWTLIAYDPAHGEIRHYLPVRIREQELTATFFKPPGGFDAANHLRGSLGRFAGKESHEVRLALDPVAAADAREAAWHHEQLLAPLPDGRTRSRCGSTISSMRATSCSAGARMWKYSGPRRSATKSATSTARR